MGKVIASQSISIDGYSAGIKAGRDNPLGDDGERLHEWLYGLDTWREHHNLEGGESNADGELLDELFANLGAVIMGRTMFECGEEPWGDEPPFHVPVFVLAHEPRDSIEKHGGTSFNFVHEGIEHALELAQRAAGDKDVSIAGGADTIQQFVAGGLIDELQIDSSRSSSATAAASSRTSRPTYGSNRIRRRRRPRRHPHPLPRGPIANA